MPREAEREVKQDAESEEVEDVEAEGMEKEGRLGT